MKTANRKDTLELLPWYENGTLDDAETEGVRALLTSDLEANRHVRELRALRAAVADEPILATNMAMNLRRLYARIDPPPQRRPVWFVPLSFAAAATLMVAAGLGIFVAGEQAGRFHVLTTPAEIPAVSADSVLYRVDVAAGVDAAELAALTGVPGARVLQGPSERGVALLAVPSADAEQVVARLHADPRLRFVTPEPR
jgi:anti-sigma factor RsiW